jgi:deoxyribodipyrimidine photo-lyase
MLQKVVLFWFRRDLRLHDNAGLYAALSSGLPVVPLFIFDREILNKLEDKDDRRVSFIYRAVLKLQEDLLKEGSSLCAEYGSPEKVFLQLTDRYSIQAVYTNHDYEPYATKRDAEIKSLLQLKGIAFHTYKDQVVFEKNEVTKAGGGPYTVFTPYAKKWKNLLTEDSFQPLKSEQFLYRFYKQTPSAIPSLEEMGFMFNKDIPSLEAVDENIINYYHQTRNIPSVYGTTRMGIQLRFGTVSVRKLVAKALELNAVYLSELIWREFFMQVLWHQPELATVACKKRYDSIRWRNNEGEFQRWCRGKTGYPIVDAGMRELNETGFMHNRVRMVVGSFLVKDLLIDWRWGEAYFARKLLDFELAANNGNWQWVAGCGCDAAPYFRVFNPALQAKKFDPQSIYIKRWIPELGTASYPKPIVEHDYAKQRCLKAYKTALLKVDGAPY